MDKSLHSYFILDAIARPCLDFDVGFTKAVEIRTWMNDYTPLFYLDVITYPCSTPYAGLANIPDNKVHGANMGPTWVLSAPDGPHVGPINLPIRDMLVKLRTPFTKTEIMARINNYSHGFLWNALSHSLT